MDGELDQCWQRLETQTKKLLSELKSCKRIIEATITSNELLMVFPTRGAIAEKQFQAAIGYFKEIEGEMIDIQNHLSAIQ